MEFQKAYTVEDNIYDTTKEFHDVVKELCEQLKSLKMEQWELKQESEKSVEFIDSYDMVIQNKVWILHKLVDGYSNNIKSVELIEKKKKKEVETVIELPEVPTNVVSLS